MFLTSAYTTGEQHIQAGLPCQDRAAAIETLTANGSATIISVADGHGHRTHFRSHIGAELAIKAAEECIGRLAPEIAHGKVAPDALPKAIMECWSKAVGSHMEANPCPLPPDTGRHIPYGCTLLAAWTLGDFSMFLQIGDGLCVAVDSLGTATVPVPADPQCHDGNTTSMCGLSPADFRIATSTSPIALAMLCTDGISDISPDVDLLAADLSYSILRGFLDEDPEPFVATLKASLPELSHSGGGDDAAIAMWINPALAACAAHGLSSRLSDTMTRRRQSIANELDALAGDNSNHAVYRRKVLLESLDIIESRMASL